MTGQIEVAVTGQIEHKVCDHIVGVVLSSCPEYGGVDRLSRESERADLDESFGYCPCCGSALGANGTVTN